MKLISILLAGLFISLSAQADLVLYSDRAPTVMTALAQSFEQKTGQKVVVVQFTDTNELIKRAQLDIQMGNPVDVVYVKDIVFLSQLVKEQMLVPVNSSVIEANIPAYMRGTDKTWTALTYRARTLVYNSYLDVDKTEINIDLINTYADLGRPELLDNLCMRTSAHTYNRTLVSELITTFGYEVAKETVTGWVGNFAEGYPTTNGDSAILKALADGECAVAVINSYYLGQAIEAKAPYNLSIKFLNQDDGGVMINGTAAGVFKTSPNVALAQQLLEYMTEPTLQTALSNDHKDFPANPNAQQAPVLNQFPKFTVNQTNWSEFFLNLDAAKTLTTEVGYN